MDDNIHEYYPHREAIHILVVDPDPYKRRLLQEMLLMCNYQATAAEDVDEASSLLTNGNNNFDIAMIDVDHNKAEGFDFMEMVVQLKIFTIQISAAYHYMDVLVKEGIECGAHLFMPKPIELDTINCLWQHIYSKRIREDYLKEQERKKSDGSRETSESGSRPKVSCDNDEILTKEEDGEDNKKVGANVEAGDN